MTLERYPSAMDDARAACRRRESTGTRGAVAGFPVISMRLALFFVVLSLAPRAVRGQGTRLAGESCTSDSDCYAQYEWSIPMCAGGVCCTSRRGMEGMGNCSACGTFSGYSGAQRVDCVQCPAGFELTDPMSMMYDESGKCDQTCDTSTEYSSGSYGYQCAAKKNAGVSCDNDGQWTLRDEQSLL